MSMEHDPAEAARRLFERVARDVPAATANRLRLARRAALANPVPRRPALARWAMPLGAAAALVVGLAWWRQDVAPVAPSVTVAPMQAEPVAAGDAVAAPADLPTEDDADLYAWLAEAPVAADTGGSGAL
jgi:hypothetical protein